MFQYFAEKYVLLHVMETITETMYSASFDSFFSNAYF